MAPPLLCSASLSSKGPLEECEIVFSLVEGFVMATLIKDPVCGMMVDPSNERKESYRGKVYAFCSESCRQKFHADPESYAAAAERRRGSAGDSEKWSGK